MTLETEALLYECRTALLQYSDEQLDALLAHWFAFMIGEETMDEELDDLCLLLDYRVQSWGAKTFYGTYTAWWEVEGYLVPEGGIFSCANVQSLRQLLLNMPVEQFGLVMELAYQARSMEVRLQGESSLLTGNGFLRQLLAWLGDIASKFEYIQQSNLLGLHLSLETKAQRRMREQETIARTSEQGYLVVYPSTTRLVKEAFRHWCAVNERPSISVEVMGLRLAKVLINTKTLGTRSNIEATRVYDRLMACAEPYISRSRMQQHQAELNQVFRRLVVLEEVLAEDAEQAAQDFVALWSEILEVERRQIFKEKERLAALAEPKWMTTLKGMHVQKNEPTSPPSSLPEKVVLPDQWASLLTKEQLCAFLAFLELPTRSRDAKSALVERLLERIQTDQTSKAQFFEVFAVELAVPPWELEELLVCTSTERKRWVEEGKLSGLDHRSFRKAGSEKMYPVFDRRVILNIAREELEAWRTEHQAYVHERRKAGAQAAAASRKAKQHHST